MSYYLTILLVTLCVTASTQSPLNTLQKVPQITDLVNDISNNLQGENNLHFFSSFLILRSKHLNLIF